MCVEDCDKKCIACSLCLCTSPCLPCLLLCGKGKLWGRKEHKHEPVADVPDDPFLTWNRKDSDASLDDDALDGNRFDVKKNNGRYYPPASGQALQIVSPKNAFVSQHPEFMRSISAHSGGSDSRRLRTVSGSGSAGSGSSSVVVQQPAGSVHSVNGRADNVHNVNGHAGSVHSEHGRAASVHNVSSSQPVGSVHTVSNHRAASVHINGRAESVDNVSSSQPVGSVHTVSYHRAGSVHNNGRAESVTNVSSSQPVGSVHTVSYNRVVSVHNNGRAASVTNVSTHQPAAIVHTISSHRAASVHSVSNHQHVASVHTANNHRAASVHNVTNHQAFANVHIVTNHRAGSVNDNSHQHCPATTRDSLVSVSSSTGSICGKGILKYSTSGSVSETSSVPSSRFTVMRSPSDDVASEPTIPENCIVTNSSGTFNAPSSDFAQVPPSPTKETSASGDQQQPPSAGVKHVCFKTHRPDNCDWEWDFSTVPSKDVTQEANGSNKKPEESSTAKATHSIAKATHSGDTTSNIPLAASGNDDTSADSNTSKTQQSSAPTHEKSVPRNSEDSVNCNLAGSVAGNSGGSTTGSSGDFASSSGNDVALAHASNTIEVSQD